MARRLFPALMALLLLAACDSDSSGDPSPGADVQTGDDVACVPQCADKVCGDDGCGGSCGSCTGCDGVDDSLCVEDGSACAEPFCCPTCLPGQQCGDDGCGGVCGPGCTENGTCDPETWTCVCAPDCSDPCALDDGCGNRCEACGDGQVCSLVGSCTAEPLDCIDYAACLTDCDSHDVACVHESCDSAVTPEAFEAHGLFLDCIYRNLSDCEDEVSVDACLMDVCSNEYYTCYSRDQSCTQVLSCIGDCSDRDCEALCTQEGTPEAQMTMEALRTCVNQACIPSNPYPGDDCWDSAVAGDCANELATCNAD